MLYTSLLMLVFALFGSVVGSFLNVCIDRLPRRQSIVTPPSHCPVCNRRIAPFDLVPLLSYLWLRGQCRYCHAPIPIRLPVVELGTGLIFAFLYWKFELSPELGVLLVYASLLIIIFFIDLEHQLILNVVVYPGIAVAFAFSFLWPELGVVRSLIGGAIGFGVLFLPFVIYPKGMGEGDVKLALMMGLMTGFPRVFAALFIAFLAGSLVGVLLIVFRLRKRTEPIPFGTFLATAAMVTVVWWDVWGKIYDWYLGWF